MKTIMQMLLTLCCIGLFSGGALSLVNNWAAPKIAYNELQEKLAAIKEVVPGGGDSTPLDSLLTATEDSPLPDAFRVMDAEGKPLGWALTGAGNGFQGKIHLMVGLSNDLTETLGLKVLKDTETPGLGTKIRDGAFPQQFYTIEEGHLQIGEGLYVVKRARENAREVEYITGATISSKAVVDILNDIVPRLRDLLDDGNLLDASADATVNAEGEGDE
jgi:Na+-translocating ferredoxin:NAD+ oxidoreductase subunit G